jgi:hypothetical protein
MVQHLLNIMSSWAIVCDVWYLPAEKKRVRTEFFFLHWLFLPLSHFEWLQSRYGAGPGASLEGQGGQVNSKGGRILEWTIIYTAILLRRCDMQ